MIVEYERIEITLRDGTRVLGKDHKERGHCALTYSNRTQAAKAAAREPDGAVIQRGRPFYVALGQWPTKAGV
jgi:hypothetical protein